MPPPLESNPHLLVTGASGCIGGAVCLAARALGWKVTGLVREGAPHPWLTSAGVVTTPLQFQQPGLASSPQGDCTLAIHALARIQAASQSDHFQLHIEGLKQFLPGLPATLRHLVLITSLAPLAGRDHRDPVPSGLLPNGRSPLQTLPAAERLVAEWSRSTGIPVTILRPGLVYGPRERWFLPTLLARLKRGEFRFLGSGEQRLAHTAAGNLAHAALLAVQQPMAAGQVYHVTDDPTLTQRDFIELVAQRAGLPIPRQAVPRRWAQLAARHWWPGRAESLAPKPLQQELHWLGWNLPVSLDHCRADLGYHPPLTPTQAVDAALAWYREHGSL